MKVGAVEKYDIEDHTFNKKCVSVTIDNVGNAMRIFAESTYSRPIEAVVRETIANGVDASRHTKIPLDITVPSMLDANFKVRDYGVGLSEDFFTDGYARVGYSTKRDNNDDIGGFGQGRFAAFAYAGCDQFYVRGFKDGLAFLGSVVRDADFNIKVYVESASDTSEPNGTEVIIPVQVKDHGAFEKAIKIFTEFLDPPPICPVQATKRPTLFEGKNKNWKISEFDNQGGLAFDGEKIRAVMGGVPYKLDLEQVFGWNHRQETMRITAGDFIFPIGSLAVPASREELRYDDATKKAVRDLFKEIKAEIEAEIVERQKHMTTDWECWTDPSVGQYRRALGQSTVKTFRSNEIGNVLLMHGFDKVRKFSGRSTKVNDHLQIDIDHNYLIYLIDDEKSWRRKIALDVTAKVTALDAAMPLDRYNHQPHAKGYIVVVKGTQELINLGDPPVTKTSSLPLPPRQARVSVPGLATKVTRVPHYFTWDGTHPTRTWRMGKWVKCKTPDFTVKDRVYIPFSITKPVSHYDTNLAQFVQKNKLSVEVVGVPEVDWKLADSLGWLKLKDWMKLQVTKDVNRAWVVGKSTDSSKFYAKDHHHFCAELAWLKSKGFKLPQVDRLFESDVALYNDMYSGDAPLYKLLSNYEQSLEEIKPDPKADLNYRIEEFKKRHTLFFVACANKVFSQEEEQGGTVPTLLAMAKKAL